MAEIHPASPPNESTAEVTPAREVSRPRIDFSGWEVLLQTLRNPVSMRELSLSEWDALIPQANCVALWRQLAAKVRQWDFQSQIPVPVRRHVESAMRTTNAHSTSIRWEVNRMQAALRDVDCPLILLKGAAYLLGDFSWSAGRYFYDVDILAPADQLQPVEDALRKRGWESSDDSPLDAMYFRQWLQELPPMWHHERQIQVDIHHNLIPPKDRVQFDPTPLLENRVQIAEDLCVLSPVDMFLHATTNLFWTGEFTYLLRDLYDMHAMLTEFSDRPEQWHELTERTQQLKLTRPCFYALRYLRAIFETPIPDQVLSIAAHWQPGLLTLRFVDALVRRTLFPDSLDHVDKGRKRALKIREYWSLPRMKTVFTKVFWLKRIPSIQFPWRAALPEEDVEKGREND